MTRDLAPQRRFPVQPTGFATALDDEPVLLDGLKVVFDEKVALVPVTLESADDAEASR